MDLIVYLTQTEKVFVFFLLGLCLSWDIFVGIFYSDEERVKIEWVIGVVVLGDSKKI